MSLSSLGGQRRGRLAVITLGCKVNQYESAFLLEQAEACGWQSAPAAAADLVVVNSCTVTARADRQVRQLLRQLGRRPACHIVVTGCYAQRAPQELAAFPGVMAVMGNAAKASWPQLLRRLQQGEPSWPAVSPMTACRQFQPMPIAHFAGHTRAFVKIQDGCSQHCRYCIVPQVRGPERSLAPEQVVEQLQTLTQGGFRELVLTGINLSRYGRDRTPATSLAHLCHRLQGRPWPVRFRLSSLEPQDVTPALIAVLADWQQFCPHFHLPLQSGSDEVLQAMQRPYQAAWFADLVQTIAGHFPQAAIGLDVLVGFPTETEAAYRQTRDLLTRLPWTYLHVFPFSPRPGTPAAALPRLCDDRQAAARAKDLRQLAAERKQRFLQRQVGVVTEVLVEGQVAGQPGMVTGLTPNYVRVNLPGPKEWANRLVRVRLTEPLGAGFRGIPDP